MKILVAPTDLRIGSHALLKGMRYVASDNVAGSLAGAAPGIIRLVADATAYTRPWRGEDLAGKTLLIYRSLGLGDEFLAARLCEVARRRYNAASVKFACFEAHHSLWTHAKPPFELLPSVVPWDVWSAADYHVIGERWWESLATTDQPDCFGIMSAVCGISLPEEDRLPLIPQPPAEVLAKTAEHLGKRLADRPLVLWQLAATSKIRSYPPDQTRKAMALVLERTNAAIIAVGHPTQVADYEIEETDRVAIYSAGIPGLIALTGVVSSQKSVVRSQKFPPSDSCLLNPGSCPPPSDSCLLNPGSCPPPSDSCLLNPESCSPHSCVVCPDSVLGHIAAVYPSLPVVSLWSSFDPARRVASYRNHRPIYNRIRCSPCWSHEQHGDPREYKGCPLTSCGDHCAGLRTISPVQIAEAVHCSLSTTPTSSP
jgi:hypothetical protein